MYTRDMEKNSRVLHHRFAILGTVLHVYPDGYADVQWDGFEEARIYALDELVDVTGEGV